MMYRSVGFGTQSRGLKPWMIALIALLLTVVTVATGLLAHFLVSDQKMEYYHGTFKISDLQVKSNSGQSSPHQLKDLQEMSENLLLSSQTPELFKDGMDAGARYSSQQAFCQMNDVIQSQKLNPVPSPTSHKQPRDLLRVDEIFIDSALNKHYIKNQVVRLTPEEDGVTADVIMVFQFPSAELRAVRKRKIHSILNEKISNTRALSINASSVEVNAMSSSTGKLTVQACCGKRVVPLIMNRIMSGEIVVKSAWPWQASLQHNNTHQCGATLISNTWLVTAAHCFKNKANPHQWTVSFGTTINPPLMKRNIKRIIVHERYHSQAREYDIAVVQLSPSVTFTDEIRRVCLPEASVSFQPNSTVYVTGFGALFYGGESQNDLRETRLKIISDDVCKQPHMYGRDIKFGMFCAGYLEGIYDACGGDSGGPLVGKDLKDTWYLIGIVSWGDNCGQKNKPGVYTKVAYYRNWITSRTGL
ncbi:transmembrane protease serine 11A isoform X2 [Balaenoptera musculus]|uniref:Transmembrane protease serine 11A isoform X2 n=1 Tax=Balaenoptera musculus TaxID=9771 RepID=A0A8B8XEJ7_BALMU|nr:transmembrane protease serine 11A isoform X2 [Balaenoptera musculus]